MPHQPTSPLKLSPDPLRLSQRQNKADTGNNARNNFRGKIQGEIRGKTGEYSEYPEKSGKTLQEPKKPEKTTTNSPLAMQTRSQGRECARHGGHDGGCGGHGGHGNDVNSIDGIYLHIPFCFHKCHYCDFYSIVDTQQRQARFTDALICELTQLATEYDLQPHTLFAGGGTPTLLEPTHWQRLLRVVRSLGLLDQTPEFTVEANPETVTDELASILHAGGVSRISIGAQSFNPQHLKTLERWHDPTNVTRSVQRLRTAGIDNINLDLIFGIPGQTVAHLADDIDQALALQPTHLSCYSLTFEPKTALSARRDRGDIQPLDEYVNRDMYAYLIDRLDHAGFDHYEISAWAKRPHHAHPTDYRCQHNLTYWQNGNWIGIGPGAASHIAGQRWKNMSHLGRYLNTIPNPVRIDEEHLTRTQRQAEILMMGLRLRDGITIDLPTFPLQSQQEIERYTQAGLLEWHHNRLRLTHDGLFVADSILADIIPT